VKNKTKLIRAIPAVLAALALVLLAACGNDDTPAAPEGASEVPDVDVSDVHSNSFEMEWPPRSGRMAEFPEVDRAGWFGLEEARRKLLRGQLGFISRLLELLELDPVE
jgi:hypothetical protein